MTTFQSCCVVDKNMVEMFSKNVFVFYLQGHRTFQMLSDHFMKVTTVK